MVKYKNYAYYIWISFKIFCILVIAVTGHKVVGVPIYCVYSIIPCVILTSLLLHYRKRVSKYTTILLLLLDIMFMAILILFLVSIFA